MASALPDPISPGSVPLTGGGAVWVAGEGERVLLLHGWGLDPYVYGSAMLALAQKGFHLAAPSLGVVGRRWTLAAAADRVSEALDTLGWPRATIVGNSLGGAVATAFAAAHPRRVRVLVLVDPVGLAVERALVGWALPWRRYLNAANLRAAGAFGRNLVRVGGLVNVAGAGWYARGADLTGEVEAVRRAKVRSAVMWGEHDRLLPLAMGRDLASALGAPLRVVPGADHDWTVRYPALFARELAVVLGAMLPRRRLRLRYPPRSERTRL